MKKIYVAGKLDKANGFKEMRKAGYDIISRWIDIQANDAVVEDKAALWDICLSDASSCEIFILYLTEKDTPHFGTIVEFGHALAAGARAYIVNDCECYRPHAASRKEAIYHDQVTWVRSNKELTMPEAFDMIREMEESL